MRTGILHILPPVVVLWGVCFLFPPMVQADQPELPPVPCIERQEPLRLTYGEHTTGCAIQREGNDEDRFSFVGDEGDHVRVIVRGTGALDPYLEIRDADDNLLDDGFCSTGSADGCDFSVRVSLPRSGTYFLTLRDLGFNDTGGYQITLECLSGRCPATPPIFCRGFRATIVGGERDNTLIGTADADVIVGLGGNDIIYGLGGNDVICGGAGNDVLLGGGGWDRLFGDAGSDILDGGGDADCLVGGANSDILLGGRGNDILDGGTGNDTLDGGLDDDRLSGSSGSDICDGNVGTDRNAGGCEVRLGFP